MKITLAALAVLLAGPASAQVVKRASAAPAAPVAPVLPAKTAVESLFDRLVKDGDAIETPTGTHLYLEVRRRGSETGAIAASVQEFPVPEAEGMVRDLVYRRSFSGVLQITEQDRSIGKDGTATLESRTYVVSLDGRVIQVMATRVPARVEKDGSLTLDESKTETKTEDAKSAETLKRWKALEKELPFITKTVEA